MSKKQRTALNGMSRGDMAAREEVSSRGSDALTMAGNFNEGCHCRRQSVCDQDLRRKDGKC